MDLQNALRTGTADPLDAGCCSSPSGPDHETSSHSDSDFPMEVLEPPTCPQCTVWATAWAAAVQAVHQRWQVYLPDILPPSVTLPSTAPAASSGLTGPNSPAQAPLRCQHAASAVTVPGIPPQPAARSTEPPSIPRHPAAVPSAGAPAAADTATLALPRAGVRRRRASSPSRALPRPPAAAAAPAPAPPPTSSAPCTLADMLSMIDAGARSRRQADTGAGAVTATAPSSRQPNLPAQPMLTPDQPSSQESGHATTPANYYQLWYSPARPQSTCSAHSGTAELPGQPGQDMPVIDTSAPTQPA